NVALNAFAADVRTMSALASGDFVYFVEKDDAAAFDSLDGNARDLVHVDQLLFFLLNQVIQRLAHAHLAFPGAAAEQTRENILEIDVHFFEALRCGDFERGAAFFDVDFYRAVVELAATEALTELFSSALIGFSSFAFCGRRAQKIEEAFFRIAFSALTDF